MRKTLFDGQLQIKPTRPPQDPRCLLIRTWEEVDQAAHEHQTNYVRFNPGAFLEKLLTQLSASGEV